MKGKCAKSIAIILASVIAASMAACGSSASSVATSTQTSTETSTEVSATTVLSTAATTSTATTSGTVSSESSTTSSATTEETASTTKLGDLLLEDSAHWMDDDFSFNADTTDYNLTAWLETYGIRFTPVVTGEAGSTVKVTMSGSGIEETTQEVKNGEQFILNLTQARKSSNPEGTGDRGIEDDCVYKVSIQDSEKTYTLNITRPGLQQYVDQFKRKEFDMSKIEGAEAGKTMTYFEYVPADYDKNKQYPVVMFLHGVGQRANEATDVLLRNAAATTFVKYGKECIVIAPQCNYSDLSATSMWADTDLNLTIFGKGAYQILQDTKAAYSTDSNRTYIVGLSMGGLGTCGMLATYPDEWAGAIVCAAPFNLNEGAPEKLSAAIKGNNIPVWFAYAEDDNSVAYSVSHDVLMPVLDKDGTKYQCTVFTPDDYLAPMRHFCWAPIWANEGILDWLLAQNKSDVGLTDLLAEDSALGTADLSFDPATKEYSMTAWNETYGIKFTPVITGNSKATVTIFGTNIETTSDSISANQTFELKLADNRVASDAKGTGTRGMEDDADYKVVIDSSNGSYTVNVHRPGNSQYIKDEEWGYTTPGKEYFTKETFALNQVQGYEDETHSMYYWLHVPSDYDKTKSYPIIMYLHGGGQTYNRADDILMRNSIATAFLAKDKEDAIIIAPQANYTDLSSKLTWGDRDMAVTVFTAGAYSILTKTMKDYNVDTNRVYLTGLSQGSVGSSILITTYAKDNPFTAALLCIDPVYGNDTGATRLAQALESTQLPVWYIQQEHDATSWKEDTGYTSGYRMFTNLKCALWDKKFNTRISIMSYTNYLMPTTHFSWARVFSDDEKLDWLLAQKREKPTE